jgi:predicted O-methyltransferase YrrM
MALLYAGTIMQTKVGLVALLALCALPACGAASAGPDRAGVDAGESAQAPAGQAALDARVRAFLDQRRGSWRDLNVPEADGRTMHDLIVARRLTRALEIGTSTGHSGIWIAWALSKTGGRLTTIEIDADRHRQAVANFRAAGLDAYVDARLGDAHELTRTLPGPWDFVFSDADKEWYPNYLAAVWPKVVAGGCFTAHNVAMRGGAIGEFLDALARLPDGQTRIDRSSSAGLSITCKAASR